VARTRIELRGDKALARQLAKLRAQTDGIVGDTARGWADDVRDTARGLAPRRTGKLRRGITARVQARAGTASVGTHNGPFYGHLVENGTSHSPAQPYLGPAARRHQRIRPYALEAIRKRLP